MKGENEHPSHWDTVARTTVKSGRNRKCWKHRRKTDTGLLPKSQGPDMVTQSGNMKQVAIPEAKRKGVEKHIAPATGTDRTTGPLELKLVSTAHSPLVTYNAPAILFGAFTRKILTSNLM